MSGYREGAAVVQPTGVDAPFCGGVCGMALYAVGTFFGHELLPLLGWLAVILSIVSSSLGIASFVQRSRREKR